MTEPSIYEFGDIELDLRRMSLRRSGTVVPLEPKAFDVLRLLIEHRDRLVTKDELLEAVWKDTFVTPNVLTRAVAQIRNALGDAADRPTFIETVPRRGYRFMADVRVVTRGSVSDETVAPVAPSVPPLDAPLASEPVAHRTLIPVGLLAALLVAVVAGVGWMSRSSRALVPGPVNAQRLTIRRGNNMLPTVAPDGHAIAYVSDRTGSLEIYVVGVAGGSGETAITNGGGQNDQPAWSPDGSWIAFHSRARGGIWIVPSTGGTSRQVVETGSEPAWSPDGTQLAFASGEGGMAVQSALWVVNTDGTNQRPLTRLGAPRGGHHDPAWSHDGRSVAFTVMAGGGPRVWIVSVAEDQVPRQLVTETSRKPVFGPEDRTMYWSPFVMGLSNDEIRGAPFNSSTRQLDAPPRAVLPLNQGRLSGVSIAANGTLAFGLERSDINIWAVGTGTDDKSPEPVRVTDDVDRDLHPDYSSDGRIAYVQSNGKAFSTWVMKEDGSGREPLLANTATFDPYWTADGSRLIVSLSKPSGPPVLAWIDAASRRLVETPVSGTMTDLGEPRLSPDAREVAYHVIESSGAMNVWTRAIDGGAARRLSSDAEAISYPVWSPDGLWLAVEIKRGERTHVGVLPRSGGQAQQLTDDGGQSWPYSWSPDGKWITYAGERGGVWNVYAVSAQTKATRQLTHFTSSSGYVRYPSWSPRGDRIAFERAIQSSDIWVAHLP